MGVPLLAALIVEAAPPKKAATELDFRTSNATN